MTEHGIGTDVDVPPLPPPIQQQYHRLSIEREEEEEDEERKIKHLPQHVPYISTSQQIPRAKSSYRRSRISDTDTATCTIHNRGHSYSPSKKDKILPQTIVRIINLYMLKVFGIFFTKICWSNC